MLNETYSEGLRTALSRPSNMADDAAIISIDRLGADVRVRRATDYIVERLTFSSVHAPSVLRSACMRICVLGSAHKTLMRRVAALSTLPRPVLAACAHPGGGAEGHGDSAAECPGPEEMRGGCLWISLADCATSWRGGHDAFL